MKNVIYHNDPADPLFGTTTEIDLPDPPAVPRALSATGFMDHCYAQLGGGTTGMSRFAAIIRQARASASDLIGSAVARYDKAETFAKDQVATFATLLVSAGLMTAGERTAILDNWPTG